MAKQKKRRSEPAFNLAALRKVKRLTKRVVAGLEEMERYLMKLARLDRASAAEPEEREPEPHGPLCPSRVGGECLCGVADRNIGHEA